MRLSWWNAALVAAGLTACGQNNTYQAPPPPKVTVAKPVEQKVTRYFEATGNTAAVNSANLVARVQGFLTEIAYQDGAAVKKGQHLFTIEPEPYQLKLQQAQASETAAQATAAAPAAASPAPASSGSAPTSAAAPAQNSASAPAATGTPNKEVR